MHGGRCLAILLILPLRCTLQSANPIKGRTITAMVLHLALCATPNKMGLGVGGWTIVARRGSEVCVGPGLGVRSEWDPKKKVEVRAPTGWSQLQSHTSQG